MTIEAIGVKPSDAIAYWQDKVPMSKKEYGGLGDEARVRGFFVSGLAKGDLLDEIKSSLGETIASGGTFQNWKKGLAGSLEKSGWTGATPFRLETIYRNNVQSAYMAGRYAQQMKTVSLRPYMQISVVNDERTRAEHKVLAELVYRADSPFWDIYYPPNGHRCRCTVKTLSARQVRERGLTVEETVDHLREHPKFGVVNTLPQSGFDRNVGKDWWAGKGLLADEKKHPEAYAEAKKHKNAFAPKPDAPQEVKSYTEMCRALEKQCQPYMGHKNPVTVKLDNQKSFMSTYSDGRIMISQRSFHSRNGEGVFKPSGDLKDAWNAMVKKQKLSWEQEYAVESLWHEILHNRQIIEVKKMSDKSRMIMETTNQWIARRTYQDFMKGFGAKPIHQKDILKKGLGYNHLLSNFDALLAKAKIPDKAILADMIKLNQEVPRNTYIKHLPDILHKANPELDPKEAKLYLEYIGLEEKLFNSLLNNFMKK